MRLLGCSGSPQVSMMFWSLEMPDFPWVIYVCAPVSLYARTKWQVWWVKSKINVYYL